MLTAVLARAEFFTLAVAGHMLELSDGRSSSTSREPSQQVEAAAERSLAVVAGGGLLAGATVGAASCCGGETSDARTQTGMLMQPPAEHLPRCLYVVLSSRFCQYCVWLVRFRLLCPQRQAQKHGEAARSE